MYKLMSILLMALICVNSVSCQKGRQIAEKNIAGNEVSTASKEEKPVVETVVSPEIEKLQRVFASCLNELVMGLQTAIHKIF